MPTALTSHLVASVAGAIVLSLFATTSRVRAQFTCRSWDTSLFSLNGTSPKVLLTWDDGGGPALYAGGAFTSAGGVAANRIARWTGSEWQPLGEGLNGEVLALAAFDDGSGPALYAGGAFTFAGGQPATRVARWDGSAWSAAGTGTDDVVLALAVWDDGRGPALYAGGVFTAAGSVPAQRIARFDGTAWTPLGSGTDNAVRTLAAFDDGRGSALYAGGDFSQAGGSTANRLARWNGTAWSAVGDGLDSRVHTLAVWDDGGGIALYAGGSFRKALPSLAAFRVVRWDGSSFSPLGDGLGQGTLDAVLKLHAHDDGSGSRLYAGGEFERSGGRPMLFVSRWDGTTWSKLGAGTDSTVLAMATFDGGSGTRLFVGGQFRRAGASAAVGIATWNGSNWRPLHEAGTSDFVRAFATFDDGSGYALFAGGAFGRAGGVDANGIARFDGNDWSAVGSGFDGIVNALAVHDDGTGPALYAGGEFVLAGSTLVNRVARWDGSSWTALGPGFSSPVLALAAYDDGAGPALFAGGTFDDGGAIRGIARWDGSAWTAPGGTRIEGTVAALAVHDDGSRRVLVVGGSFPAPVGAASINVATWDGSSWGGLGLGIGGEVFALASFGAGPRPEIYAGGRRDRRHGFLFRFDGSSWRTILFSLPYGPIATMTKFHDGWREDLYIGGNFGSILGVPASKIARWNGSAFSPLGTGMAFGVNALAGYAGSLFAGGHFTRAGGASSSHVAMWADPCAASFAGSVNLGLGERADVLFVNDSTGGPSRTVFLRRHEPVSIFMDEPPASRYARFALYLWTAEPRVEDRRVLPRGIGSTCLPTPLSGGSPQPRFVWNNSGHPRLGAPTLPSMRAPSIVLSLPAGTGRPATFVLQGIVADPGSAGERPASVTNAVTVDVR